MTAGSMSELPAAIWRMASTRLLPRTSLSR